MMQKRKTVSLVCLVMACLCLAPTALGRTFVFSQGSAPSPIPQEILEDAEDVLVLANRDSLLDKDYPPSDALHKLVDANVEKTKNEEMLGREVALAALEAMFEAGKAEGLRLRLHSAYRSHYRQSVMYELRLESKGRDDGYVQPGGASEHQTGLAFDVVNPDWIGKSFNSAFADTKEGQWMAENCARFGFIIRYPKDKEDITEVHYEPWHLRYVGVEVATYITENGLTLEEFTEWRQAK